MQVNGCFRRLVLEPGSRCALFCGVSFIVFPVILEIGQFMLEQSLRIVESENAGLNFGLFALILRLLLELPVLRLGFGSEVAFSTNALLIQSFLADVVGIGHIVLANYEVLGSL